MVDYSGAHLEPIKERVIGKWLDSLSVLCPHMVLPASVHVSMQSGCPVVIAMETEALSSTEAMAVKALGKVVGHQGVWTGREIRR